MMRAILSPILRPILNPDPVPGETGVSFSPSDIANLGLWLDANDDATFTGNAYTGEVSTWTDKSSNARVFSPTTGGNLFVRDYKPQWNGKKVVMFNNTSGYGLACPTYNVQEDFDTNAIDQTVFTVFHSDDITNTFGTVYYHLSSGGNGSYFRLNQTAGNIRYLAASTTSLGTSNSAYVGQPNVVSLRRSVNVLQAFVNGTQQGSDVASTAVATTNVNAQMFLGTSTTGGGSGLLGDLAELIIYKRALTTDERTQVENYLGRKWIQGAIIS